LGAWRKSAMNPERAGGGKFVRMAGKMGSGNREVERRRQANVHSARVRTLSRAEDSAHMGRRGRRTFEKQGLSGGKYSGIAMQAKRDSGSNKGREFKYVFGAESDGQKELSCERDLRAQGREQMPRGRVERTLRSRVLQ
jgi:hypothetical protein